MSFNKLESYSNKEVIRRSRHSDRLIADITQALLSPEISLRKNLPHGRAGCQFPNIMS